MSWAQRLKAGLFHRRHRLRPCGGTVRIVASIEEPALLQIVGGDKLIILSDGAAHEPIQRPAFSA